MPHKEPRIPFATASAYISVEIRLADQSSSYWQRLRASITPWSDYFKTAYNAGDAEEKKTLVRELTDFIVDMAGHFCSDEGITAYADAIETLCNTLKEAIQHEHCVSPNLIVPDDFAKRLLNAHGEVYRSLMRSPDRDIYALTDADNKIVEAARPFFPPRVHPGLKKAFEDAARPIHDERMEHIPAEAIGTLANNFLLALEFGNRATQEFAVKGLTDSILDIARKYPGDHSIITAQGDAIDTLCRTLANNVQDIDLIPADFYKRLTWAKEDLLSFEGGELYMAAHSAAMDKITEAANQFRPEPAPKVRVSGPRSAI